MAEVSSTSDERTVNNAMRHGYRVLSDAEKQQMQALKDTGLAFWQPRAVDRQDEDRGSADVGRKAHHGLSGKDHR
ncbi:hypothetical protein GCM10007973_18220 [Polymorphobacter multimanifer]|uniref:Uncharacterized protein n=1 Tax=Polymorphobacter multimanifer TaxID=1070431 RepID=A0A841L6V6_9SPHN|nr:hypothetical protein [Polymorphobacter multimanifer]MBB6228337.1 hypothetical protein [Polymorphobacter multimanifer]GGI82117.1 hypothetical protein GCM10007973_18220 [Polymorphobacter multimanifer]